MSRCNFNYLSLRHGCLAYAQYIYKLLPEPGFTGTNVETEASVLAVRDIMFSPFSVTLPMKLVAGVDEPFGPEVHADKT